MGTQDALARRGTENLERHTLISSVLCIPQVWAAIPPWKQGSLAEFVCLSANEVLFDSLTLSDFMNPYHSFKSRSLKHLFIKKHVYFC